MAVKRKKQKRVQRRSAPKKTIKFTVASALIRELGERLVGRPHIALAELVKNSYDADAGSVVIRIFPDRIEIVDNGHGMDFAEFREFWMRIGSPHKQEQQTSRKLRRPMTGSKGVGRLAVQFLANLLEMRTVADKRGSKELVASVNWSDAVQAGELTKAEASYAEIDPVTELPGGSRHGTAIVLSDLKQTWSADAFEDFAREIWWLQPPFRTSSELTSEQKAFDVRLESADIELVTQFETQMSAYLNIWYARLVGKLVRQPSKKRKMGKMKLSLEFADGSLVSTQYDIPKCLLHSVEFEVRVFHLIRRQPYGIRVGQAREYLNAYGGVHVYDTGFHLPYYGPHTDWLRIEIDHSHRLSTSRLLPEELQVRQGMTYLPTNSRLLGVVHVDTSRERRASTDLDASERGEYLKIQVTRDRLVDNKAYQNLQHIVRWALDFYAMQEAQRAVERAEAERDVEPVSKKFERVDQVLEHYESEIPPPVFQELRTHVATAIEASQTEAELVASRVGLLGSLATAGMSALALEHEMTRESQMLRDLAAKLRSMRAGDKSLSRRLAALAEDLESWMDRAQATRAIFAHLLDEQNRGRYARFKAKSVLKDVATQVGVLIRDIPIDSGDIDRDLRLPKATFADWSAVFQNVLLNAVNAMLDAPVRLIRVRSDSRVKTRAIVIEDTGFGVDLEHADELFEPFVRHTRVSSERRALGYGGSGMGLAIVRMIASTMNCKVGFVEPSAEFATAFRISWSERK